MATEEFTSMTKERYRKTARLSRPREHRRIGPFPDHYGDIHSETSEEHPVDLQIDAIAEVARRRRKLIRMAQRWLQQVRQPAEFITYEDARLQYSTLREELYFNAGFERGRLVGRADSRDAAGCARRLAHQLGLAVAVANLPHAHVAAALLDVAKAVVLGLPQKGRPQPRKST